MHHRTAKTQMLLFRSEAKGHIPQFSSLPRLFSQPIWTISRNTILILICLSQLRSHRPSQPASEWSVIMEVWCFFPLHTHGERHTCWIVDELELILLSGWEISHHNCPPCSVFWNPGILQEIRASVPHEHIFWLPVVTALHCKFTTSIKKKKASQQSFTTRVSNFYSFSHLYSPNWLFRLLKVSHATIARNIYHSFLLLNKKIGVLSGTSNQNYSNSLSQGLYCLLPTKISPDCFSSPGNDQIRAEGLWGRSSLCHLPLHNDSNYFLETNCCC